MRCPILKMPQNHVSAGVSGRSTSPGVPVPLIKYPHLYPHRYTQSSPSSPWPPFNMASTSTLRPHSTHGTHTLHLSLLLLSLLTPYTAASSRRVNSRFLNLDASANYSKVYRALDEGMRDQRRLDAAFRSVDLGQAVNVFDVARAIMPGEAKGGKEEERVGR